MSLGTKTDSPRGGVLDLPASVVDLVLGVVFLAASIWYVVEAQGFPTPLNASQIGAGAFPTLLGVALVATSLAILAVGLVRLTARDERRLRIERPLIVGLGAVILVVFALLFDRIGAIVSVTLLTLVTQFLVGERRWPHLLGVPLALALLVYVCFVLLLGVKLP